MKLSNDQEIARDKIHERFADGGRVAVLAGAAGTGKTTIMRQLADDFAADGNSVVMMAPTGKAAARLRDLSGRDANTIHSLLFGTVFEDEDGTPIFADPHAVAEGRAIVVCDEASMVGSRIYDDILAHLPDTVKILFVGDREQLPPVGDVWGPDFSRPTALLEQVHRQAAGSPIIQLATAIRKGADWRKIPEGKGYRKGKGATGVAAWTARQRAKEKDVTLLTFTNKRRHALNAAVRNARGLHGAIEIGDRLVCTFNNRGLGVMNGELRTVRELDQAPGDFRVARWAEPGWALVAPPFFGCDGDTWKSLVECLGEISEATGWEVPAGKLAPKRRALRMEYGECLTVHKSQGSQWDTVCFVMDGAYRSRERKNPEAARRLLYTAVTRAAERLFIVEV